MIIITFVPEYMESIFSLLLLLVITLLWSVVLLLCGGILSLCGIKFAVVMKYSWWLLLLPLVLFAYGVLVERNCFKHNIVIINSEHLPDAFDNYRIVHISDLHLRSFVGRRGALQKAVDKINNLMPDMIVFSGDLVTLSSSEIFPMVDILSQLKARDGIFSVMGNHDYLLYARNLTAQERAQAVDTLKRIQADMGWHLLDNQCVNLYRGKDNCITVIGIENLSANKHFESYGDIPKACLGAEGQFKILISHDPSAWERYVVGSTDIDLTLSGHTHNMQFSLFGASPSAWLYKHHSGLYSTNTLKGTAISSTPQDAERVQYLYVNIGLGETIFPARIGAPGEITEITLKGRK